ncbi:hypothetical protein B0T19DRAFT_131126 [Cercophora scortea]|uniref:MOZ protein represents a chromatin-associated acetyltransferase n=1 Tax=Cercophora scortea TaxID=314031 RepID=A0AAE0IYJ5_9PEZI|nr:hypothetical protein B0T19DRAFT_131126 [Cercophora scortea]
MATNRLTFLYPHLYRTTTRWTEPAAQVARNSRRKAASSSPSSSSTGCCPHQRPHASPFSSSSVARQAAFAKRAGTGVEPQQGPADSSSPTPLEPKATTPASRQPTSTSTSGAPEDGAERQQAASNDPATTAKKSEPKPQTKTTTQQTTPPSPSPFPETSPDNTPEAAAVQEPPQQPESPNNEAIRLGAPPPPPNESSTTTNSTSTSTGPMETILHMGPPSEAKHKPPHLSPPPYVHHFDSYSLVKQLCAGGHSLEQAITAMKAVRGLLAENLDVAQASLVSKSDVENESYLFRAACSELSTEVTNNRRVADEALRQQRTHLLHEVDILTQQLNQELLTLNDTVRGMFNDRRMAVREEQKAVDSAIQQINYKISVMLNSDAKSDIEGLRWVLIRRSVLGIIFMAFLTLGTLRYASYLSHEKQKQADRRRKEKERAKRHDGTKDNTGAPDAAEILAAN